MWERKAERSSLGDVRQRLERWREQHGGRGRRIPEEVWKAVVEVARANGVDTTAQALRVDRGLLARRVELASGPFEVVPVAAAVPATAAKVQSPGNGFIEFDSRSLCAPGKMVVHFEGRDGEKLHLELSGAGMLDAVELARAFWSRVR